MTKNITPIKILVFDCWLPGYIYIQELAERKDVSLIFVHNSNKQLGMPAKEYLEFKRSMHPPQWVHNFSDFGNNFNILFKRVKPDILLVTSMHYVEHRSALLFAKKHNIFTAFIPHGIFGMDAPKKTISLGVRGWLEKVIKKIPRAIYYTDLYWRTHFQIQRTERPPVVETIKNYIELIVKYPRWQWRPSKSTQAYYSGILKSAFIYDYSVERFYKANSWELFRETDFIKSGTLDSGKLLRVLALKPKLLCKENNSMHVAYFVSSPNTDYFIANGAIILAGLLKKLSLIVISSGYAKLIYRRHPGEPQWFVDQVCQLAEIEKDQKPGIEGLISADLVCGASSSLMYNAVILKKPIIIIESGQLYIDAPYYEPLISYPKITINLDLELAELLNIYKLPVSKTILQRATDVTTENLDPLESMLEYFSRCV